MVNLPPGNLPPGGQIPMGMPGMMPGGMQEMMPGGMPMQMPGMMPGGMQMPGMMPGGSQMPGMMPGGMQEMMPGGMPMQMPGMMPGGMQMMPGGMPSQLPSMMPSGASSQMQDMSDLFAQRPTTPGGFPGGGFPGGVPGGGFPGGGFPGGGFPGGGFPGTPVTSPGQAQAPRSAPPQYTPERPQVAPFAVDPGAISGCLNRMTYVWLTSGVSFWFYPTFVGRRSVAGFRWSNRRGWVYLGISLNQIEFFTCNPRRRRRFYDDTDIDYEYY